MSYQGPTMYICDKTIQKCNNLQHIQSIAMLPLLLLLLTFPILLCFLLLQAYIFRIEGNTLKIVNTTKGKKVRNFKNFKCS